MARKKIVRLTDDLDGTPAETTVRFGWDGVTYEIDLNTAHAGAFSAAMRPYLDAARRVAGPARRGRRTSADRSGSSPRRRTGEMAAIRAWAHNAGYQLADRGRIPTEIIDAYHAVQHQNPPATAGASSEQTAGEPGQRATPARKTTPATRTSTTRRSPTKKTAAKKTAVKKAAAKATVKKATVKKTAAKKAAAKRVAAKPPGKKAVARRRG